MPISAGCAGVILGPAVLTGMPERNSDIDSQFRYLSGLLLGIGLAYLLNLPDIERKRARFLILGAIVVIGGLGRLFALLMNGIPSPGMLFGLAMELLVTPAITLWQVRISRPV